MENNNVVVWVRVSDGVYVVAATMDDDGANDCYWADYYNDEPNDNKTIQYVLPLYLARLVVKQGTNSQYFNDGYEAFDAIEKVIGVK